MVKWIFSVTLLLETSHLQGKTVFLEYQFDIGLLFLLDLSDQNMIVKAPIFKTFLKVILKLFLFLCFKSQDYNAFSLSTSIFVFCIDFEGKLKVYSQD